MILQKFSHESMHTKNYVLQYTITNSNFHELVNHLFPQVTAHIKQPTAILS